ncbi:hypothetical protein JOF41_006600 [Saccharothrix coeruleofusca]|uniref:hypothetical protein n=1 Tax=Saccharothrix coeruleofusca TaxID=33919 RepID=UPI001FCFB871|nr:hypothetical protein [Saccharothrix coeruleofusca]MBP2340422.1 hypothetical protein [Saccharothrix coeruleofusca]
MQLLPGTHPDDHLNRPRSCPVVHVSPGIGHAPVPVDLDTITALIYLTGMAPDAWEAIGPDGVAEFILRSCEDPRVRVPELVALVACAHRTGHVLPDYYAQVEEFAPAVLAVFTRAVSAPASHKRQAGRNPVDGETSLGTDH